jgi:hypothetical protein
MNGFMIAEMEYCLGHPTMVKCAIQINKTT